jgi:RNA polymerase primary sigma factor
MRLSSGNPDAFDRYLEDIGKYPPIRDRLEERELGRRVRAGDPAAAERLVTANLRFVVSFVHRYRGRGLELNELVCLGNEGLLKAVERFDPDREVRFTSYAVWWIRQTVLGALIEQTGSVRIPRDQNSNLVKLAHTNSRLAQTFGRSPTDAELATEMQASVGTVRALRSAAATELRLDALITRRKGGSTTVGDRFHRAEPPDIEAHIDAVACRRCIDVMLEQCLTHRERKILYLHYGLDDGEEKTLQSIGTLLGVTRERIRQIRNQALKKLVESPQSEVLSAFWNPA